MWDSTMHGGGRLDFSDCPSSSPEMVAYCIGVRFINCYSVLGVAFFRRVTIPPDETITMMSGVSNSSWDGVGLIPRIARVRDWHK